MSNIINQMYKTKYYVYEHYIEGNLFYIGKGKNCRATDLKIRDRSHAWNNIVKNNQANVEVRIVANFDTDEAAIAYERKAIKEAFEVETKLANVIHNNNNNIRLPSTESDIASTIQTISNKYLNILLTTSIKKMFCNELNLINSSGRQVRWPGIKILLIDQGYKITDAQRVVDGKKQRISILSLP